MTKLELCKEIDDLKNKILRLEQENTFLIDEMLGLTKQIGIKPSYYDEYRNDWGVAMANKASLAIKKVLEMRS